MRTYLTCRKAALGVLAVSVLLVAVLISAASALAAEACSNEAQRTESLVNPTTGKPYSQGLPECRAYEMVSPLDKGSTSAEPLGVGGVPVSPAGDAVGFESASAFAGVENQLGTTFQVTEYLSRRASSGWVTEGAYAPAGLIDRPYSAFPGFSADLISEHAACGQAHTTNIRSFGGVRCALRRGESPWIATPEYLFLDNNPGPGSNLGGSADLSRVFIELAQPLLPSAPTEGLYEIAGLGTTSSELRLVNIDNSGDPLLERLGEFSAVIMLGDAQAGGTSYQAISENGETVFFTAIPTATQEPAGEQQTIYARVHHEKTVAVSNPVPAECTICDPTPGPSIYQGASAAGSKVFFTTAQQLLNGDTDKTTDLYMYDFANPPTHHLVQLSAGGLGDLSTGAGATVLGVLRSSSDGSHIYFVATGVLTTVPNALGQVAQPSADNLYGVDTNTGETKFVGALSESDAALWGEQDGKESRSVQTTPNGRYLVFSTFAHLSIEDTNNAQAAYRYDFQTGELTWLSHSVPGFPSLNEGKSAVIASITGSTQGGQPAINDWNRAITSNGEDVIFTTAEQLQADDINVANDVYLWHNGTVGLISDGKNPLGIDVERQQLHPSSQPWVGISQSGSDIFFFTQTQLVGQDADVYQDLYDARVGGGFPAPTATPSCTGEEWTCQGKGLEPPAPTRAEGSANQPPGDNLIPPPFKEIPEPRAKPAPRTNAQRLSAALAKCRKLKGNARKSCEKFARKRYAPKSARPKSKAKRSQRVESRDLNGSLNRRQRASASVG